MPCIPVLGQTGDVWGRVGRYVRRLAASLPAKGLRSGDGLDGPGQVDVVAVGSAKPLTMSQTASTISLRPIGAANAVSRLSEKSAW